MDRVNMNSFPFSPESDRTQGPSGPHYLLLPPMEHQPEIINEQGIYLSTSPRFSPPFVSLFGVSALPAVSGFLSV